MTDLPPKNMAEVGANINLDENITIQDIEWIVNTMGFAEWDTDNEGQIVIYTGYKFGPKGLEKYEVDNGD